jgi:hypothetical protein
MKKPTLGDDGDRSSFVRQTALRGQDFLSLLRERGDTHRKHPLSFSEGDIDKRLPLITPALQDEAARVREFALVTLLGSSCKAGTARVPPPKLAAALIPSGSTRKRRLPKAPPETAEMVLVALVQETGLRS